MAAEAGPQQGHRSEIPNPRARTPSPIRDVQAQSATLENLPLPAREFDFALNKVDVVYAEDEEVFRETAIRELVKVGFDRKNIHESENGLGALTHLAQLQAGGHEQHPLLVLLDVRMPGMDGKECALRIQELCIKKALRRVPFVVCISSIHRQVTVDEGKGNFQVVLPKPFTRDMVNEAVNRLRNWWTMGETRQMPAWKKFETTLIDVVAADEDPMCRYTSAFAFQQAGILAKATNEVDDVEELIDTLKADDGPECRPLIVLLGTAEWATDLSTYLDSAKGSGRREPFVVCTSVDSERISTSALVSHFHAFLPRSFSQADVKWCLELCRLWFLTRGDGKDAGEVPDDSDGEAEQLSEIDESEDESDDD